MSKNTIEAPQISAVQALAQLGQAEGDQGLFLVHDRKKAVKTASEAHHVYSTEPYAQEMYNLLVAASSVSGVPNVGDIVEGRVVNVRGNHVVVDAGLKDFLYVDVRGEEAPFVAELVPGERIVVMVVSLTEEPYHVAASLAKMQALAIREELDQLFNIEDSIQAVITGMNPGGYTLQLQLPSGATTLFMPHMMAGVNKLSNAGAMVGTTTTIMLDSFSEDRGTYIASRKRYLETLIPSERAKLDVLDYESLLNGGEATAYEGTVTGATSFGIFVEFNGCLTGMIHKANVHPDNVDPEKLAEVQAGTPINFYVKEIAKGGRIILTQMIRESLWDTIRPKQKVTGTVRDVKHFGVLVKLDDETTGLVHSSEVAKGGRKMDEFKRGDSIDVRVLMVNKGERKIFLALSRD